MRITVNLGMFFHDHKSLVRIYVNKNLKCIQDVEKHISNIFNVHNFYLKSENHYLPPTEDVRVLNDGDIVWYVLTLHFELLRGIYIGDQTSS
jgi:hypothetical protein